MFFLGSLSVPELCKPMEVGQGHQEEAEVSLWDMREQEWLDIVLHIDCYFSVKCPISPIRLFMTDTSGGPLVVQVPWHTLF